MLARPTRLLVLAGILSIALPRAVWCLGGSVPTGINQPFPHGTFLALSRDSNNQRFPPFPQDWRNLIRRIAGLSFELQLYPQAKRDKIVNDLLTDLDSSTKNPRFGDLFSLEFDSAEGWAPRPRVVQLARRRLWVNDKLKRDWGDWTGVESAEEWLRNGGQMSDNWIVDLDPRLGTFSGPNGVPYYNDYQAHDSALVQGYNDRICIMWDLPGPRWRSLKDLDEGDVLTWESQFETYVVTDAVGGIAGLRPHNALGFVRWHFKLDVTKGGTAAATTTRFSELSYEWVDTYGALKSPPLEYLRLMRANYDGWLRSPTN